MLVEAYKDFYQIFEKAMGDRSGTVGASEIGLCERQTFARKNEGKPKGVKRDKDFEDDWGARIRGTIMEFAFWVPAMRKKYGDKLLYAGTEQQKWTKDYLSSTPDGLLIDQPYDLLRHVGVKNIQSDCIAVEGKTIDPRTNLVEAKDTHTYQANTQLGLIRDLTPYKPVYNLLTYTDASFWSEVDEFPIKFDAHLYAAAHDRAHDIITAKSFGHLLPEGWISGGKECTFCPFTDACGIERAGIPRGSRQATPQFAAEMEDTAKDYNKIKLGIVKQEATLKLMEHEIKQRLKQVKVRRIPGVVNWYGVAAPVRYKNKDVREAFIELGGDPEEFTKVGVASDRLVVSATPNQKTKNAERVGSKKQPKEKQRAGNAKKPNLRKRVGNREQPKDSERVSKYEKPKVRKRVIAVKKPIAKQRAKTDKKPTFRKRPQPTKGKKK